MFEAAAGATPSAEPPGFAGGSTSCEVGAWQSQRSSPRSEGAGGPAGPGAPGRVRSQYEAIRSVAGKIGCNAETLRGWARQAERDAGQRPGVTTDERARLIALDREVTELRRANEILRKASAYVAQAAFDRRGT